jgi:cardiolipin synthase
VFERYVRRAKEVQLEAWTRRGWPHKLKDNAFYLVNELL